ncbi:MAG: pilus assembly protein PilM [Alphaproteobacteria bacterium]|nr:pilus assembly protein PilM [Alphaproteobacteria bacterium]
MSERSNIEVERINAGEVFAAWRAELAALAKERLGETRDTSELRVVLRDGAVALHWVHDGIEQALGGAASLHAALASNAAIVGTRRDAVLALPSSDVLRPVVRMPHANERILRSALQYELEKLSPVPPDEVYFDFRVLGRDREANTVEVELRIIRRAIVDDALALCGAAGLSVGAIRFEGDPRPADRNAFPVDRAAWMRGLGRRHAVAALAGLALALLLAVLLASYLRGAAVLDSLTDELLTEGARASRVEQLQHRIDKAGTQLAFLAERKRSPLFVAILADVSRTLPDGSWLTDFSMSGAKIRVGGYSRAASDLIGVFDRSGRFANAQFAAPVTQGPSPGIERFDLSFDVAGAPR